MATFTYTPSFPASQMSKPRVNTIEFGDGYRQSVSYGLNPDLKAWTLVFDNRNDTERNNIIAFLEARKGSESFDWTDPFNNSLKWTCTEWNVDFTSSNKNSIRATFVQIAEP